MQSPARTVALTGADQVVRAAASIYRGITLRETAGATAVCVLYDNASAASGTILDAFSLAANASVSFVHDGIWAENGIFVDIVSGTLAGSVRIG